MSVIWRKVWRDLAHNKTRTLLVVLATAVGLFALGLVFGMHSVMSVRMTDDRKATVPSHITFRIDSFDQEVVEATLREQGVADAEGETHLSCRWRLEHETDWRAGDLIARADYDTQRTNLIDLLEGHWPAERTLALERRSARYFNTPLDTTIVIDVETGRGEQWLSVKGIVRVPTVFSPRLGGNATFCVTPETAARLTGYQGFNRLNVRLESFSQDAAREVAGRIERRLELMGVPVRLYEVTDPNTHPVQETVDAMFIILAVLGVLSLALSAFLIINTMNAIIAQQVWQIGVMKVVGATSSRVTRVYLITALAYGGFALLLAIPLGAIGAYLMADWLLDLLDVAAGMFHVTLVAVSVQIVMGLAMPVVAALVPVIGGARITPHQAIRNYGLGAGFGRGRLDHLLGHIRFLPPRIALSLRNTFRRKVRVVLALLTLTLGGTMFIMVMSVSSSLDTSIERLMQEFGYDVLIWFDRPYHTERLLPVAESVPGMSQAEVWDAWGARVPLANDEEHQIGLWGLPPESAMFTPRIVAGRWLHPDDDQAIVLNSKIASQGGFQVGDEVELIIGEQELESVWTVVGVIFNINNRQRSSFVPFDALARELGFANQGAGLVVLSEQHDTASQQALGRDLHDAYAAQGLEPRSMLIAGIVRQQSQSEFDILIYLMLAMTGLAAVVGSFGLMSTMSINVVERGREIGVMRAIGGTPATITGIFVGEGILVGVLSWLFAVPLSLSTARLFSQVVGDTLLGFPLDFHYSVDGVGIWLAIVVVLSALASLWPVLRATRISVRQALAYE